jgi:hypothetical protein
VQSQYATAFSKMERKSTKRDIGRNMAALKKGAGFALQENLLTTCCTKF